MSNKHSMSPRNLNIWQHYFSPFPALNYSSILSPCVLHKPHHTSLKTTKHTINAFNSDTHTTISIQKANTRMQYLLAYTQIPPTFVHIQRCTQKFQNSSLGQRKACSTVFYHQVLQYHHLLSQCIEFCSYTLHSASQWVFITVYVKR